MIEYFLILREMDSPNCIVIFCQAVPQPKLFRKKVCGKIHSVQCLAYCLCHGIVGKPRGQTIEGLKSIEPVPVFFTRVENLRML